LTLTATNSEDAVSRSTLKKKIGQLFADEYEVALFYFAGHGYIEDAGGGYIVASDCESGEEGIPLAEVLALANRSKTRSKIIVLDSCFAGIAGNPPTAPEVTQLSQDLTIIAASTEAQYASEDNNSGVFTTLFVDALNGAAANLVGDVTPGSVYAHVGEALGPWEQRPVFKTNMRSFVSLRSVPPPVSLAELRQIATLFPCSGYDFKLDPSFEPESPNPTKENTEKFAILQRYNRVNLVVPHGAPHMWHAAMQSKSCKLTPLGEHFRKLAAKGRI